MPNFLILMMTVDGDGLKREAARRSGGDYSPPERVGQDGLVELGLKAKR
jgi:hypothetical protein